MTVLGWTAAIAALSAAGLWYYARRTHQPMGAAAKHLIHWSWFKKHSGGGGLKKNPIERKAFQLSSHNEGRRVAYQVWLEDEVVRMSPDESATFYRNGVAVARFRPTPYQFAKIRSGYGKLSIYTDQLIGA